jgi:hypothetical protein
MPKCKEPDLKVTTEYIDKALKLLASDYYRRLQFLEHEPMKRTPDKPNFARSVVPVRYDDQPIGDMYVIVFMPGDGTGDEKTFKLGQLEIPKEHQYAERPEKVLPRRKDGVFCEGMFPIFSTVGNTRYLFTVSLEELTVDNVADPKKVIKTWDLGMERSRHDTLPSHYNVYLTTGHRSDGKRFGDPHAIVNATDKIQVAGFLAITDEKKKAAHGLTSKWIYPAGPL